MYDDMLSHLDTIPECDIPTYRSPTGWVKLNGANAVSFVVVKHVLDNCDYFWQEK